MVDIAEVDFTIVILGSLELRMYAKGGTNGSPTEFPLQVLQLAGKQERFRTMCELFAMSASTPQRVRYELDSFARQGGEANRNRDGWGIYFAEERDGHLFREAAPASDSELAAMVVRREIPCRYLVAHVRRATAGKPLLANTHPFSRVLHARSCVFAHNGELEGIEELAQGRELLPERIGDTDSELAFLMLLARLRDCAADDVAARFAVFNRFAAEMRELGTANFLFFDGVHLYAHADRRRYDLPDGLSEPREPGLNIASFGKGRKGNAWQTHGASIDAIDPPMCLLASVPLDGNGWEPLKRGTTLLLRDGVVHSQNVS